jgi:hypothetical protein
VISSTSTIIIRKAKLEDAASVGKLHADSWRVAYRGVVREEFLRNQNSSERAAQAHARIVAGETMILIARYETDTLVWKLDS